MNNEPITCRKCAHVQYSGTNCDYCGHLLIERRSNSDRRLSKFAKVRILGFAAILVIFFFAGLLYHRSTALTPDPAPVVLFPAQQSGVLNKVMKTASQANKPSDTPSGTDIFAKASPGIVTLYQDDGAGKPQRVIGAGFLLDGTTIATNNHVISGGADITARFGDGTNRKITRVLRTNQEHDVALLQIDKIEDTANQQAIDSLEAAGKQVDAVGLTSDATSHARTATDGLTMGRTSALNIGDTVIAAGSPNGLGGSLSQGIVTAMAGGLIKTNLPVSSGWSGGPLFNMQGEVIGMLTSQPPGNASGNYSLPIEWATTLFNGVDTSSGSHSASSGAAGSAQPSSHAFGPYSFKLAALEKHSLPFTTPNDLENASFAARLTATTGSHLHITISRQAHVMYDSGDTAGAHFTLSLKRGDYVMLVENTSKSAPSDVSISGAFANDN
jgi:S1-C subfamily serine protease